MQVGAPPPALWLTNSYGSSARPRQELASARAEHQVAFHWGAFFAAT